MPPRPQARWRRLEAPARRETITPVPHSRCLILVEVTQSGQRSSFSAKILRHQWSPASVHRGQGVLVYLSILHDDHEVLVGFRNKINIINGIPIDHQQICKRIFFDDP
jgi:hypothetical protein